MPAQPAVLTDRPAAARRDEDPGDIGPGNDNDGAVLADVLRWLHIGGALFLRAEFSRPWGYTSPPAEQLTQALKPGARRLILFHLVPEGDAVLTLGDGTAVALAAGDVIILPYADQHSVASDADAPLVPIGELLPPVPWGAMPVIRHGGGGAPAQIVCGYLHSDELRFNPVLGHLPTLMHLRPQAGSPLAAWVDASFRYALHASTDPRRSDDALLQRLPELLFAECLRMFARTGAPQSHGWFAALAHPVLSRALALLHGQPARPWTLDSLALAAASSRSRLDAHFRSRLGMAPMAYLAQWRLQMASRLLRSTVRSVADIAEQVGYGSEASLSRAFKRYTGCSPAAWRRPAVASSEAATPTP